MELFENRDRAEAFGEVAADYDSFRPSYPSDLVAAITGASPRRANAPAILDVGSGTGILAEALRRAGAEVLAVEPDAAMADVARAKGLNVEVATFEDWDPTGRTFDLVTFGQSFHWVDPAIALPRIKDILNPGGALALAWNDIEAAGGLGRRLTAIADRHHHIDTAPSLGAGGSSRGADTPDLTADRSDSVTDTAGPAANTSDLAAVEHPALTDLRGFGFTPTTRTFTENLHYGKEAWLNMVFTYSAQLTMDPVKRASFRAELAAEIPDDGLDAVNEALLILAPAPPYSD